MGLLRRGRLRLCVLVLGLTAVGVPATASAQAQDGFIPINPTKAHMTITLTGEDLTIQQLVDIARYGAKVKIAKQPHAST